MKIKDIIIVALMSAILLTVQVVAAPLPNIELVSLLVIIYTLVFKWKTLFIIYIFAILEGLIYGFGQWWFTYLYVWTVLFVVVTLLSKIDSVILWACVSGMFGLVFGALCAITYFFIGGPAYAVSWWISGITFDLIHGVANFIVCLVLFKPIYLILTKMTSISFSRK
ncbi:MAG: hypothetical protein FWF15_01160 [Oscillospiraceae bacterium]|nr:hypothetical protein [Oscillospiraceae bacterium]